MLIMRCSLKPMMMMMMMMKRRRRRRRMSISRTMVPLVQKSGPLTRLPVTMTLRKIQRKLKHRPHHI